MLIPPNFTCAVRNLPLLSGLLHLVIRNMQSFANFFDGATTYSLISDIIIIVLPPETPRTAWGVEILLHTQKNYENRVIFFAADALAFEH